MWLSWLLYLGFAASLLYLLGKLSPVVKFYVKYVTLHLAYVTLAGVSGVFCLYRPGSSRNIMFPKFFYKVLMLEWWFGVQIKVENIHFLNDCDKPCVIISNHQSSIDTQVVMVAAPVGSAPLAKKILLYVPFFGPVCWLCGTIFINRKKGQKAIEIMKRVGEEMKEKMTSVWIFPEGTRIQEDTIGPFKKGAFHLAVQAQVPIVPVVVSNTRNVIDLKNCRFDGGLIRAKCLEPVQTEGLTSHDVDDLIGRCHSMMLDEFNKDYENHKADYAHLPPVKKSI